MISAVLVTVGTAPANAADYEAMSGEQLYMRFCAFCHGIEGRGDGPVAQSFASKIPDLTSIARRHGGEFQRDRVVRTIHGRHKIAALNDISTRERLASQIALSGRRDAWSSGPVSEHSQRVSCSEHRRSGSISSRRLPRRLA